MKEGLKTLAAYTNPFAIAIAIPIGVGCLSAALISSVFGGTYRNMKKIVSRL